IAAWARRVSPLPLAGTTIGAGDRPVRSIEGRAMLLDERLEGHRGMAAELLDKVIRACEDAVLVVDRDLFQMLNEEGIARGPCASLLAVEVPGGCSLGRFLATGRKDLQEGVEADLLVFDALPQRPAQDLRDLLVGVFDRAEKRVHPTFVRRRIFEDAGDDAC